MSGKRKAEAELPATNSERGERVNLTLNRNEYVGKVLRNDEIYGEWRTVPGFDEEKLQVSSKGYLRVRVKGGWTAPSKGYLDPTRRYVVKVNGFNYKMARFVCRAFDKPQPSPDHEADHIDRDATNNEASNVRWATKQENLANRREVQQSKSTCQPMRIRHRDWPEECDWEPFESAFAASKAYGLNSSSLRAVANTAAGTKRSGDPNYQHNGFLAEWLLPAETQGNLSAGDDSNLREAPPPAGDSKLARFPEAGASTTEEQWKQALDDPRLWVSDRGRVQTKHPRGNGWGPRRTPQPTDGMEYARVNYKGKMRNVHNIVYLTFGRCLLEDETIDHKVPSRKFDNRFVHLRAATQSEQIANQDRKPRSEIFNSMKKAVWGKPKGAGGEAWEWFESANDAQRTLHARFPDKTFYQSAIGECADGTNRTAYGWVFRRTAPIPPPPSVDDEERVEPCVVHIDNFVCVPRNLFERMASVYYGGVCGV
tara:strand:- start:2935 stop:4380 length:1446 start_codon:yes stop_codon:yes gene_type:complete